MVCTEGNTNRECSFFWVGWWDGGLWMDGGEQKVGGGDVRASKPAIGDGVLWTCKRKAQPEAQLGDSR